MRAFEKVNGSQPGFRKNHAKGVSVTGYFDGNGNGSEVSSAVVFRSGRTPVMGRFSLSGGNAHVADTDMAARGFGLAFGFPGATQWRTAMLNLPSSPTIHHRGSTIGCSRPSRHPTPASPTPRSWRHSLPRTRRPRRP